MSKRVLLVVPSVTSYDVFFRGLPAACAGRGLDLRVAAGPPLSQSEPATPRDCEVMELPAFRSGSPAALALAAWRLARHVRSWRPAIVHSHFAAGAACAAVARSLAGSCTGRWVTTFHGLHGSVGGGDRSVMATLAERVGVRGADVTFVLNREDANHLARRAPRADVRLVEGFGVGCDLSRFDSGRFSRADVEEIKGSYGLGKGPVLAFIGRKTEFKGYAIAIDALRIIQRTIASTVLVVAGTEDAVHGDGGPQRGTKREPGVIDLGWQPDVAKVLAIADVCVFPSAREGMPVNLMEALAMGVPCVTSDARGCRDVVRSGVDGLVVSERTPEAIARSVKSIVDSADMRRAMREAAIAGRRRFDREDCVRRQVEFYEHGE